MYRNFYTFLFITIALLAGRGLRAEEDIEKNDLRACEEIIFTERKPLPQELESCIYILESSSEYAAKRPWIIDIGKARLEFALSNFKNAVRAFTKMEAMLDKFSSKERFRYYILYSAALDLTGELDKAKAILYRGVEEAIREGDSSMVLEMYIQLGNCYKLKSRLDSSVYYYRKAMNMADLLDDVRSRAIVYLNFGTLYLDMHLADKARECYNKALNLAVLCNDHSIRVVALSNMGALLYAEEKYDSSIAHSLKLQQLLEAPETKSIQDIESYAYTLFILGNNYSKTGDRDRAKEHYIEACSYFKDMNDQIGLFAVYQCLNDFFLNGEDYETSIKYGDSVLFISERTGLYNNIGSTYDNLAKAYEVLEDYKKATVYHKLGKEYNAEAYDVQKVIGIEDAMLESGLLNKTKELDEARSEMQFLHKYKKALTVGLILTVILTLTIVYAYRKSARKNKNLTRDYEKKEKYIKKQEDKLKMQQQKLHELQSDKKLPLVLPNGVCIQPEDIIYIKSEDHYLILKMKDNSKQIFRSSLVKFGKKLPPGSFLRVHYSYIINLSEIVSVRTKDVVMTNQEEVKIGPTYLKLFKQTMAV